MTNTELTSTALITGANKGIGLETARQLAARGMTVLLGARDISRGTGAERELRAEGHDARFVHLDVTDDKLIAAAAALIAAEYGQLDVLVNNAGIVTMGGAPSATSLDGLRAILETNVLGVIAVTNAMLPLLRRAPSARIVNVSSEVGSITLVSDHANPMWAMPASVPYPVSKAALNMVTAMYAKELLEAGILVNAANPGYCATDLNGRSGFRAAAEGAEVSVTLATLPDDGPTGTLWGYHWGGSPDKPYAELPW
jgi:NAD(P)-dependent dehydrogenase (short-subunit alcohol dehydrogenase family)